METLIELYVNEQFDNLAAALTFCPQRVVFLSGGFMPDRQTMASAADNLSNARNADRIKKEKKEAATDIGNVIRESLDKIDGQMRKSLDEAQMKVEG